MMTNWVRRWLTAGALTAALPLMNGQLYAEDQEDTESKPLPARVLRILDEKLVDADAARFAYAAEAPASRYWIGIGLGELPEIAKKQLGIEHGLVVGEAFPESPAAKAGFQAHDILMKVGETALKEPADLVKAVEEAKETEMSITLLRGGKELTLKVTPMKRPEPEIANVVRMPAGAPGELQGEIRKLEEALAQLKNKAGGEGLSLMFARPGVVMAHAFTRPADLPKDLSVQITKEGDQPTKIHVKKGDKEWNLTEEKLGELPDDVRPHVQNFFGRLWTPLRMHGGARYGAAGPYSPPVTVPVPVPPQSPAKATPVPPPETRNPRAFSYRIETRGTDQKLDEIMKELKQLRKEVDELRANPEDEKK
jgi:hypothetical protein